MKYDQIIEIDGYEINKHYIQSLSKVERESLIEPIFQLFRQVGFLYPDNNATILKKEYQRLLDYKPDINNLEIFNNSSVATKICKHFCPNFFKSTDGKTPTMEELFNDDIKLKKTIRNRLGLDWLESDDKGAGVNEAFNLSFKMLIQGFRSQRLVSMISIFKPIAAKYMCMKYSNEGDLVYDYSAGFGGRLLGAMSCNRKYIGTDPLTVNELENMAQFYQFNKDNYKLIKQGSEQYCGAENSIDFSYSSPPYFDQEIYSKDLSQAYNNGEEHFYNIYWEKTLENIKYMLKPGKWFGLNIKNNEKMLQMAIKHFGEVKEAISLRTIRSHLNKSAGIEKNEYIYMFINNK